jgi:hypothetical protein
MELPDAAAAETVKNDRREIFDMAVYSLVVIRVYLSDGSQLNVIIQFHRRILYQISSGVRCIALIKFGFNTSRQSAYGGNGYNVVAPKAINQY